MAVELAGILFLGTALSLVLFVLVLVVWVAALFDLAVKRHDLTLIQRLAWAALIVLLPIIGTVLYFFLRPTLPDEAERIIATRTGRPLR